jgi:hypothetical protein
LPDTVAVPTTCQPDPHDVGALAAGPNTLNVIVPPGDAAFVSTADTDDAVMAAPSLPVDGALSVNAGATTDVCGMAAPQVEVAKLLFASPL